MVSTALRRDNEANNSAPAPSRDDHTPRLAGSVSLPNIGARLAWIAMAGVSDAGVFLLGKRREDLAR
jgi:hypothetical protein